MKFPLLTAPIETEIEGVHLVPDYEPPSRLRTDVQLAREVHAKGMCDADGEPLEPLPKDFGLAQAEHILGVWKRALANVGKHGTGTRESS